MPLCKGQKSVSKVCPTSPALVLGDEGQGQFWDGGGDEAARLVGRCELSQPCCSDSGIGVHADYTQLIW